MLEKLFALNDMSEHQISEKLESRELFTFDQETQAEVGAAESATVTCSGVTESTAVTCRLLY
jgi:hypothetical protein